MLVSSQCIPQYSLEMDLCSSRGAIGALPQLWCILGFGCKLDNNWKVVRALVELRGCVIGNKTVCQEFASKCQVNSTLVSSSFLCDLSLRSNEREASKI
jgi:hypothetical protein